MSNESWAPSTFMGLSFNTIRSMIFDYQRHGVDVYELDRLRWELREEKLKLDALKDRIKDLLETL